MITDIRLKKGSGVPSSLGYAEPAVDMLNKVLYIGIVENGGSDFLKIIDENAILNLIANAATSSDLIKNGIGEKSIIVNDENNNAEGIYSFAKGYNSNTLGHYSEAGGYNTTSGIKGYFFQDIEFGEEILNEDGTSTRTYGPCIITLTKDQPDDITLAPVPEYFETGFVIGDIISICNNSKYPRCSKITEINGNVITVDSLPFSSIKNKAGTISCDDYQVFCPDNPLAGEVNLGYYTHAEGEATRAIERASHAEGRDTISEGQYSHAEGRGSIARAYTSHAEGFKTISSGEYSHSEGSETKASGYNSHAEGYKCESSGEYTHVEGFRSIASGYRSHAEGSESQAIGYVSHAEGAKCEATGEFSHAEGCRTIAQGNYSHAEGEGSQALGTRSHAEGKDTIANGFYSHVEGRGTITTSDYSHVQGKFNVEDTAKKYAHIIGNGSSDTKRSNAHTVDWNGNAFFSGDVYTGSAEKEGANKVATETYVDTRFEELIGAAPEALDTLGELSAALNDNANFGSTILNELNKKANIQYVDKITKNIEEHSSLTFNCLYYYGNMNVVPSDVSLFTFTTDDDTMTASVGAASTDIFGDIVIPYEYVVDDKIYEVNMITPYGFAQCSLLENIIIPYSITVIGEYAFSSCQNLIEVVIPNSVKELHSAVFNACHSLRNISIPDSVVKIGSGMFMDCSSLISVTLPKMSDMNTQHAFLRCYNLTNLIIPDGTTIIGENAFKECVNLINITIPNSVESIQSNAFSRGKTDWNGSWDELIAKTGCIYYKGTRSQWNKIIIGNGNIDLSSTTIYYINGSDRDFEMLNMINNLHYYCNKDITYNENLFVISENVLTIDCSGITDGKLVIPYTLGIHTSVVAINSENITKIVIPRGMNLVNGTNMTDEDLVAVFVNLNTIVRIHEDGVVLSFNIAEGAMN